MCVVPGPGHDHPTNARRVPLTGSQNHGPFGKSIISFDQTERGIRAEPGAGRRGRHDPDRWCRDRCEHVSALPGLETAQILIRPPRHTGAATVDAAGGATVDAAGGATVDVRTAAAGGAAAARTPAAAVAPPARLSPAIARAARLVRTDITVSLDDEEEPRDPQHLLDLSTNYTYAKERVFNAVRRPAR